MSVKLGNTSIAGTQVLYSTTGSNIDGAMTQSATTSALSTKSNDIDVVHKTGNETIGGVKTFNNSIHFKNSVFVDAAAGDEGGEIEFAKAPNSSLTGNVKLDVWRNSMRVFGSASNNNSRVIIDANIEENALFVPSSDKINSAISTVGINKSGNGYLKLGNGIIIQWGVNLMNNDTITTINFSQPFTNEHSYSMAQGYWSPDANRQDPLTMTAKSSTSFTIRNTAGSGGNFCFWLAIGY